MRCAIVAGQLACDQCPCSSTRCLGMYSLLDRPPPGIHPLRSTFRMCLCIICHKLLGQLCV